jgi:hypothetical protein
MTGKTISERPDLDIDGIKRRLAPAECGTLCNDPVCPYTHPVPRNTNDLLEDARALLSAYEQQAGEVERLRDFLIDAFQALGSMHAHMDLKSTHYRLDLEQGDQVWALFTRIAQEFAHRITGDTK